MFASDIRKERVEGMRSSRWRWHLDEIFMKINGERHLLWRAVNHEGEVLESFVMKTRDKKATLKFPTKSLERHGRTNAILTDHLGSYNAALNELGIRDRQETGHRQETGPWVNNRVESSHLHFRRRNRDMLCFRRMQNLQKFASVFALIYNHFNHERARYSRQNFKVTAPPLLPRGANSLRSEARRAWVNRAEFAFV